MPYCPRCGNKVDENMTFCPRCGASLKMETQVPPLSSAPGGPTPVPPPMRNEKGEKQEKNQPNEKGEKHEKGEFGFVGFLIAGLVVLIIGVLGFLSVTHAIASGWEGPLTLLVVGVAIILVGLYVAMTARRHYPPATRQSIG